MATKGISVYTHNGEDYTINDPNVANEFSASTAYAVGDHVNYQGNLYVFTVAHAAGAWNSAHVSQVKLGQEVSDLKSAITPTFSTAENYQPGDAVFYNNSYYYFYRPHNAGAWIGIDAIELTADEVRGNVDDTLVAVNKMALKNVTPLPCVFGYGSMIGTPSHSYLKYRVCSVTPIVVDTDTTFTIAEGFRARRYWFNRSNWEFMTFDGSWQTGSITLTTDKIYYVNIARVTDNTNEVADISEWAQKVFVDKSQDVGQKYISLSASTYNNMLANVNDIVICNINVSDGWTDTPEGNGGIFENQRYSGSYNIQRFLLFSGDRRREHIRIVNRNTHAVYSGWVLTINQENPRILVVGDSIARGGRNSGKGFIGDLGMPYINMGVGGATISSVHSTYTDSIHKFPTADNIPNQLTTYNGKTSAEIEEVFGIEKFTPDIIVSEGGINDYLKNAGLGTLSTAPVSTDAAAGNLDRNTLIGAMEYLFYQMVKLYPKAQRFFVITHKTARPNGTYYPVTANSSGYTQQQMHDAIVSVCNMYNVIAIDIYTDSIMNTKYSQYRSSEENWHDASATDYCDYDGVHPLEYGYKQAYIPLIREAIKVATRK